MLKTTMDTVKFANGIKNLKQAQTEIEKAKAAQYILDLSKKHGGLFTKIIQLMGTSSEQIDALKKWQNSFDSGISVTEIEKIISKEFGKKWDLVFSKIEDEAYCASIGQVNRAYLLDGTEVAIKVQYPHIEKAIKDQLNLLKIMPVSESFGPMKKWSINVSDYYSMIANTLNKELDYKLEVKNQIEFANSVSKLSFIKVAKVFNELVTQKCYVQEFINGVSLDEVISTWSPIEKIELAQKVLKYFLYTVFEGGIIHEDSNHYNYLFQNDQQVHICVLDFGQCIYVDKKFRMALLKLFHIVIHDTDEDAFGYLVDLGFEQNKLSHIHPSLSVIMKILLEPFLSNYNYDIKTWDYKVKIDKVLGDMKWWFRSAGGVRFFEVMKSFIGLKNMIERLEVKVNWQQIYFETLCEINTEWKNYHSEISSKQTFAFNAVAKNLKVKVKEFGKDKVDATFPVNVLIEIEEFIDEEVLLQLKSQGINPTDLVRDKVATGLLPGEVFHLNNKDKEYRVWLE